MHVSAIVNATAKTQFLSKVQHRHKPIHLIGTCPLPILTAVAEEWGHEAG